VHFFPSDDKYLCKQIGTLQLIAIAIMIWHAKREQCYKINMALVHEVCSVAAEEDIMREACRTEL
jgi:hypothetical protein